MMAIYHTPKKVKTFCCRCVDYSGKSHVAKYESMSKLHMGQLLILLFFWVFPDAYELLDVIYSIMFTAQAFTDDNFVS